MRALHPVLAELKASRLFSRRAVLAVVVCATSYSTAMNALPYEDPSIETILILSSFFLLLNGIEWVLNVTLFCGLLGQILVGIAWGSSGLKLLGGDAERTVTQLGYIGLILLVLEGGLLSSFRALRSTLWLSIAVATTGVAVPIALSFVLRYFTDATYLQCFAAGAALCSTSLGTTITVLRSSGYVHTRLGTVLASAALLDDVVGLLMAQIIQDLGVSRSSLSAGDVVRPVASSIGLMLVSVLLCWFAVRPLTARLRRTEWSPRFIAFFMSSKTALVVQLAILIGLVTVASYAGASNLLAAYIAGAVISWWSTECGSPIMPPGSPTGSSTTSEAGQPDAAEDATHPTSASRNDLVPESAGQHQDNATDPHLIYKTYLAQVVDRVLKPLFFASIGFSVPLTLMFSSEVLWRGIVYSVLMAFGKFIVGLCLIRIGLFDICGTVFRTVYRNIKLVTKWTKKAQKQDAVELHCDARSATGPEEARSDPPRATEELDGSNSSEPVQTSSSPQELSPASGSDSINPPRSLYPGFILGSAMVARGEIGYLISSLAQSSGLFSQQAASGAPKDSLFLVVVWAISLCTLLGPLMTGLLVRRVKKLEAMERSGSGALNPLGSWGEL